MTSEELDKYHEEQTKRDKEVAEQRSKERGNPHLRNEPIDEIGFGWWTTWASLGLILGNLALVVKLEDEAGLAVVLVIINTILMVLILRYNKYAFLIATVLSLNPLLWIINGIYLKNRWNHPKVNNGIDLRIVNNPDTDTNFVKTIKETAYKVQERVHEYKVQKIAEDEAIRVSVQKSLNDSDDIQTLQDLVNKAVASGDNDTARALLDVMEKQKKQ